MQDPTRRTFWHHGGLKALSVSLLPTSLLVAQALAANGQEAEQAFSVPMLLTGLFLILLIIFVPYLLYNTLVAWIASKVMSFREATVGRAFALSVLHLLIPIPAGILLSVGVFVGVQRVAPREHMIEPIILAVLCFLIFVWLISVFVTSKIYRVGFLASAVFNVLLWVVHGVLSFVLGLGPLLLKKAMDLGAGG